MQLITLEWIYIEHMPSYWQTVNKTIPAIRFYIVAGDKPNYFTVRADVQDIDDIVCTSLDAAKTKAQEIYNSYAIYLSLL